MAKKKIEDPKKVVKKTVAKKSTRKKTSTKKVAVLGKEERTDEEIKTPGLNKTMLQLQNELTLLEKKFYEDDNRFVQVNFNGKPDMLDLAGIWTVVERNLKRAGIVDETELLHLRNKSKSFQQIFLEIGRIKLLIKKERDGYAYRKQPVLREKGEWILKKAGEFKSVTQIHKELTSRKGFNITIKALREFLSENKTVIDKLREDYKNELLNGSIVIDSGRLKFWMEAYDYYYDRWAMDRKQSDFNVCERIINNVRTEIKGDVTIKIDGRIDITHSLETAKSLGQKMGELNISLITIALAAQKTDINPLILMSQLTKSYYNKWNGIAEKPLDLDQKHTLVPISNLIKSYNWDEIREKNDGSNENNETIQEAIIIKDDEIKTVESKKEHLLRLLRQSKPTEL
jgi:hypothetical protein